MMQGKKRRAVRTAAVAAVLGLAIPLAAHAQHWTFDARRIALGGVGSANLASGLVAERRGYGTLVLPFGLLQSLGDLDVYRKLGDPADPSFDPVRAGELLASPLHYALERPESGLQPFVWDLANLEELAGPGGLTDGDLRRILGPHRDVVLPEHILWEGMTAPNWGRTIVVSGARDRDFQAFYIGAGPYFSASVDTRIDPDLPAKVASNATEVADGRLPPNVDSYTAFATTVQAAAAVTGGWRARFALPGAYASERDGVYVAANYHYLYGLGLGRVDAVLDVVTDEAGRLIDDAGGNQVAFYELAGSRSGRGLAFDFGVKLVRGRIDVGVGARGVGNWLEWLDLESESNVFEAEADGSIQTVRRSARGDTLRIELPVHWTTDVAYHADRWSAMVEYAHGFLGHRMHAGIEARYGWVELRGGGRFLRDRWHPSVGVGLNGSGGPSLDVALFGGSASALRTRTLSVAVSLRLNADGFSSDPGFP